MPKKLNLIGQKYGHLLVLCEYSQRQNNKRKAIQWVCQCDCGNEVIIPTRSLREGHTKSCGCMLRSVNNMSYERPWHIWHGMKERCRNENNSRYDFYGAKGITYCERWEDFNNFWEDMKDGYSDNLTLDRIDYNGNYCKENCRWITIKEQQNNKCSNITYTVNGQSKTIGELASEYEINYNTLYSRLMRNHWSVEKALNQPLRKW